MVEDAEKAGQLKPVRLVVRERHAVTWKRTLRWADLCYTSIV